MYIYIYWIYQLISVNVRFSTEGEKIVRAILSKFEFLFLIIFRNGLFFLEKKIQDFTSLLAGFYFIVFYFFSCGDKAKQRSFASNPFCLI